MILDDFRLDEGSGALYHFFWDELCAWYLELTKPVFTGGTAEERRETRDTLAHAAGVGAQPGEHGTQNPRTCLRVGECPVRHRRIDVER